MLNGRGIRTVSGPCGTCPYISSYSSRTSGTSSSGRSFRANIRPSSLCALMSQFLEASSDHVPTFSYSLPSNRTYSDNSRFHHRHDISRKDGSPDVSTDNIRMFQPTIFGKLFEWHHTDLIFCISDIRNRYWKLNNVPFAYSTPYNNINNYN